jgi:D-alanyl-D-alanine carboxypeptidase/D-alanyl-D-alanine-endopeptidase (penicillin-binding protein 4)
MKKFLQILILKKFTQNILDNKLPYKLFSRSENVTDKLILLVLIVLITNLSCSNKENKVDNNSKTDTLVEKIELDSFDLAFEKLINDSSLFNASISFYFFDDSTKEIITQYNPDLALVPASTMKIITTAAALEFLGGSKSFSTRIQYDGTISNRVLDGNIYIKGGGDPTLGSKYFGGSSGIFFVTWADEITALGIDSITGYIIGDATYFDEEFVPPTWSWGEIGEYYCTGACGLTIFDNQYDLKFYSGRKARTLATASTIDPYIPDFYYENKSTVVSSEKLSTYILCAPYSDEMIIKGSTPSGSATYSITGSIPDPPFLAAYNLYEKLTAKGVNIGKGYSTMRRLKTENDSVYNKIISKTRTTISTKWSPNVSSIVGVTNMRSNNLFAETFLNHIGIQYYSSGSAESGAKAITKIWETKGLDTRGLNIFDGSGISRYNSVTSRQLVEVIRYMKDSSKYAETFYNSLPISGETGTLTGLCDSSVAQGKIHAKSGTMSRVRSYAGYVETNSKRRIIFAFVVNNYNCTNTEMKNKIEDFMVKLVEYR